MAYFAKFVSHSSSYVLLLIVALAVLLGARIFGVVTAGTDLIFNEAQYWTWSRELSFGYYSKPPLIAWIIRLMTGFCGDGEGCIRATSSILYTLTAYFIFLSGRGLYGPAIGFWSAIVFVTLPGISVSSYLITTDVPLLTCWAIALYAWIMLLERKSFGWAIMLGLAIGLGLLAKQAMIYFVLCVAVYACFAKEAGEALKDWRGLSTLISALACVAPNLIWNAINGSPMFHHTAENAGWTYPYFHPLELAEYLVGQLGVFGPIFFVAYLVATARRWHQSPNERETLLLSFSLPVFILIAIQALLSHARINWAATAYPAASIFVTATLSTNYRKLFAASMVLHIAIAVIATVALRVAAQVGIFQDLRPLQRVLGWREIANVVRQEWNSNNYAALLVDTKDLAAELSYYLRKDQIPLYILTLAPHTYPANQYELSHRYNHLSPRPALYVSLGKGCKNAPDFFSTVIQLSGHQVPAGRKKSHVIKMCKVADFNPYWERKGFKPGLKPSASER